jgi:hypothetical protein
VNSGGDLLSHAVTRAVPSALKSLTSVFGMETGVSSSLWPPKNHTEKKEEAEQKRYIIMAKPHDLLVPVS